MNDQQPIYEFLLWNNCSNNCKFCHQKANRSKYPGKFPDDNGKLKSIKLVKECIVNNKIKNGSHILFMGGELFDTKLSLQTENEFLSLGNLVAEKMTNGEIGLLFLNTNLIYDDTTLLDKFLNVFINRNLESRIRFTTSYDVEYRYKNDEDRKLVQKNMKYISNKYRNMSKVANCIMTDVACKFLLKNVNFIGGFKDKYGFNLNLIPYIILNKQFAPFRSEVLSLLTKINNVYPDYFKERIINNLTSNQTRNLLEFNGKTLINATSSSAICGHNENFRMVYRDSTRCYICDCIQLSKILP